MNLKMSLSPTLSQVSILSLSLPTHCGLLPHHYCHSHCHCHPLHHFLFKSSLSSLTTSPWTFVIHIVIVIFPTPNPKIVDKIFAISKQAYLIHKHQIVKTLFSFVIDFVCKKFKLGFSFNSVKLCSNRIYIYQIAFITL